jgi:hypothetical protein
MMNIEIQTSDNFIAFELLGKKSVSLNDSIDLPGNAKLSYNGSLIRKSFGMPEIVNFTLTFGSGVAAGLVANWLYDKLKNKAEKITINRREIQLDKEEIKKIIEESIKIE